MRADQGEASAEGTVGEGAHDHRGSLAEAYHPGDLACQDAVRAGVDALLDLDHTLVVEQGSHQVQLGSVEDPDQAQNLAGVGIPEEDEHRDQVLGPYQVAHAVLVGHVRRVAVVGDLDAADH